MQDDDGKASFTPLAPRSNYWGILDCAPGPSEIDKWQQKPFSSDRKSDNHWYNYISHNAADFSTLHSGTD